MITTVVVERRKKFSLILRGNGDFEKEKENEKMDTQNIEKLEFPINLPLNLHIHFVFTIFIDVLRCI